MVGWLATDLGEPTICGAEPIDPRSIDKGELDAGASHHACPPARNRRVMPPSLRDWLGQDELAWCVLDVVAEMDLSAIYGEYRADGHGRAAFDPGMMVALLLYAYAVGERSSRAIERRAMWMWRFV